MAKKRRRRQRRYQATAPAPAMVLTQEQREKLLGLTDVLRGLARVIESMCRR